MLTKHPLFWKEWKSAKWWSVLMMGVFLMMFLAINNNLQHTQEWVMRIDPITYRPIFEREFYSALFDVGMIFLPIVVVISIMLFQSDRKEGIGEFVSSLPFTKKEQFKVKWLVGMLVITIPFAITSVLAILIRAANWDWIEAYYKGYTYGNQIMPYDTLASVMLTLLQTYLFFIAFYSFLMLVQTLIANNIAASIIGVIVLTVPWFVLEAGGVTLSCILKRDLFSHYSQKIMFYSLMHRNESGALIIDTPGGYISSDVVSYENYWLKIIILLLIMVLSIYAGIHFYGKNDSSRNGQLLMFPWLGNMLIPGVTFCSALLGNNMLRGLVRETNTIYELITLILSGFIGYVVIRKIISLSGRCEV